MNFLIKTMDSILSKASVIIMVVLVLTVLLQVFMRYVVGSPVTFTEELSRYLLIWVGLMAACYAYRQRMHLALDLLILKLNDKNKIVLNVIIHSLIGLFAITVLIYGGLHLVYLTYILEQHSPALGVSLSVVYMALPISGLAIMIYAINFIMEELGLREVVEPDQPETDIEDIQLEE